MRERNLDALHAAPLPEIEMVEGARTHPNQSIARAGRWFGDVFEAEDIWSSVGVKPDGLH